MKSADIANGQVESADIGAGEVRSGNVANDNLTGGDVAGNSLKGADIDEGTLDIGDAARAYALVSPFDCRRQPRAVAPCGVGKIIEIAVVRDGGITYRARHGSNPLLQSSDPYGADGAEFLHRVRSLFEEALGARLMMKIATPTAARRPFPSSVQRIQPRMSVTHPTPRS